MSHDRMAREFVERMAYESIGNAMQPHIPICNGATAQSHTLTSSVPHRRRPCSTGDADDHACCHDNHSDTDKEYDSDMISHMRRKISNNFQHYSNLLQGLALPMLFRESKTWRESEGDTEDMLDEFEFVESIELHDMEGFIFESEREIGQGHNFLPVQLQAPTWCDKCGDFIWGVYKQCLTCNNCQYTCHHKCRPLVTLDCEHCSSSDGTERISRNHSETSLMNEKPRVMVKGRRRVKLVKDDADSGYHTGNSTLQSVAAAARGAGVNDAALSREELRCCIQAFNDNHHGLIMTLDPQLETFQGFIRVHLNLIRPINMSVSGRPPSFYEVLTHEGEAREKEEEEKEHITSFYLPKNTTKVVHICSETTTEQVIRALLAKYKITDNPRKFALYEKVEENGKVRMQRLVDDKCPLPQCLSWTAAGLDTHMFVLQENDTGEIIWEAFSLPELENFLKILDREEAEYAEQVKAKYHLLKLQMTQRLKQLNKECPTDDKRQPVFV